jgi:nucleoside-diphosphate-sugar epimerase
MTQIAIIGATGYAGANIATEAVSRGHSVISVSRNAPADPPDGVEVRTGSTRYGPQRRRADRRCWRTCSPTPMWW